MGKTATLLLWLFVVNLGITFGAGLYEARLAVPEWIGIGPAYHWNGAAARHADVGLRFWVFVTTGPLTVLTLANLVAAWLTRRPERSWWLGSAIAALADRLFTFAYFVPTMLTLMREEGLTDPRPPPWRCSGRV
jgi:hypothetical protein